MASGPRRKVEIWDRFFHPFISNGFCLYFNFWFMPSLIGWWQVLINPKYIICHFFSKPSFRMFCLYFNFLPMPSLIGWWQLLMDHQKIIKWSPLKLFYKSTIHEKCVLYRQCRFCHDWKKLPWYPLKKACFWVYKDLSCSYREGIGKKLKYRQKPYKMQVWQKSDKLCISGPTGLVIFY